MVNWIGVDLDGTLARYDGWKGVDHIGEPIKPIMDLLIGYLKLGRKFKIFTARAGDPNSIPHIKKWLKDNGLPDLEVTNVKDFGMTELWDDRAKQVVPNEGIFIEDLVKKS